MQLWLTVKSPRTDHLLPLPTRWEPGLFGLLGSCPLLLKCKCGVSHFPPAEPTEDEEARTTVLPSNAALRMGLLSLLAEVGERRGRLHFPTPKTLDVEAKGPGETSLSSSPASPRFACASVGVVSLRATIFPRTAVWLCVCVWVPFQMSLCLRTVCHWVLPGVSEGHSKLRLCVFG